MNKKDNTYLFYLDTIVTNLPQTDEEIKKQKRYDIVMGTLILLPIFLLGIFAAFDCALLGIIIVFLSWILVFIVGTNKRKRIVKRFYKIKDAYQKCKVMDANSNIIKELYNDSALTFITELNDELLNFIYNWLNNEKVLKNELLNVYIFNGKMLKNTFNDINMEDDIKFISIFLKDLNINNDNISNFSKAHFTIGARWLSDIVDNSKITSNDFNNKN